MSHILMFPQKELPFLVFPLRANPKMPKMLHAQFLWRTHPPTSTTCDSWSPPPPSRSPLTLVLYHPPYIGLNARFCLNKFKLQIHLPFTVIAQPLYLLCAKSRRNTKSKPIYVDYVYLWCDQVVSGLLANKFLVPSFENSSGK